MQRRTVISIGIVTGVSVLAVFLYFALRQPPQMGADPAVFREVDALYTAVTAHNEKLLDQSDKRLQELKSAGKLPADASSYLDGVIATARQGRWQPAAERLHAFMKAQRREK